MSRLRGYRMEHPVKPREYPFSFRLPSDVRKAIERESRRQGCSMAFKINEVLRAWARTLPGGELSQGKTTDESFTKILGTLE